MKLSWSNIKPSCLKTEMDCLTVFKFEVCNEGKFGNTRHDKLVNEEIYMSSLSEYLIESDLDRILSSVFIYSVSQCRRSKLHENMKIWKPTILYISDTSRIYISNQNILTHLSIETFLQILIYFSSKSILQILIRFTRVK